MYTNSIDFLNNIHISQQSEIIIFPSLKVFIFYLHASMSGWLKFFPNNNMCNIINAVVLRLIGFHQIRFTYIEEGKRSKIFAMTANNGIPENLVIAR